MEFMTHLFCFFIFSFLHFFHRISRMNRKAFLLIGLLTEFRGYLASGQWLAPYICSCCFCHADFADGADFSLCGLFCPTDFTDIHRFFFVGLFPTSGGICNDRTGRICEICVTKKQIYTDDSPRFYTFYLVISLFNHTFASNFEVVHF